MASKADNGKEVEISNKGLKRFQKETKGLSSSAAKRTLPMRFRAKVVEPHGLKWFQAQKEAKYAPKNFISEGGLALEFLPSARRSMSWDWDMSLPSLRSVISL
ncbi:hypothetical protein HAX54_012191, partial [Datura stramonium]|nr:hypothetical protein [Datura stramonium]